MGLFTKIKTHPENKLPANPSDVKSKNNLVYEVNTKFSK